MIKAQILAELPHLSPQDRSEILHHLWRLDELQLHPAVIAATGIISSDIDGRDAHRAYLATKHA
jgi:hypothetical protein